MIFVFSLEFHVSSEVYNTMAMDKVAAERMYYYVLVLARVKYTLLQCENKYEIA